jgi:16S rRNA G1207 methylase RsmC
MYPANLSSDNAIPFVQDDGGFYFLLVSPPAVIDAVLEMAALRPDEVLFDLGSGDGRIVIAAARRYGVQAVGVENNPALYRHSLELVQKEGVDHLVTIFNKDFKDADLSRADVTVVYHEDGALSCSELLSSLAESYSAGGRIITIGEPIPGWDACSYREVVDYDDNRYPVYLYWADQQCHVGNQ